MNKETLERYLRPLDGGEIVEVGVVEVEGVPWPQIKVKNGAEEYILEIGDNIDGKGPGFIFGLPDPAADPLSAEEEEQPPSFL